MRTLLISALVVVGVTGMTGRDVNAQQARSKGRDVQTIQQKYGVQGGYHTSTLHPQGQPTAAIPVYLDDGRNGSGELLIPQNSDSHGLYYRDDGSGEVYPVHVAPGTDRRQLVQNPRIQRYEHEAQHGKSASWEKDALVIGGTTGAGALIGAVAGGGKGAGVGAIAGGIGGLIYDLATQHKAK
jgi:hypothetical protein